MSTTTHSIKRHNHRVHPCEYDRKNELLKVIIANNPTQSIIVVTANETEAIKTIVENEKIVVINDNDLSKSAELKCDLLISYDLPEKALIYMSRLSHTNTYALILLDKNEEKALYPIETLLGRAIMQEVISGFEVASNEIKKESFAPKRESNKNDRPKREFDKSDKPKRDFKSSDRPKRDFEKSDKPKRDFNSSERPKRDFEKSDSRSSNDDKRAPKSNSWDKKGKETSKYLGKDENGKAIFSGKSRERNHKHDGSPREEATGTPAKYDANKPKFSNYDNKKSSDKPRSFENKKRDDRDDKKPFRDDKKSFNKPKDFGDKEQRKSYDGTSKSYSSKNTENKSTPKRAPRKINVKPFKPSKES